MLQKVTNPFLFKGKPRNKNLKPRSRKDSNPSLYFSRVNCIVMTGEKVKNRVDTNRLFYLFFVAKKSNKIADGARERERAFTFGLSCLVAMPR